METAPPDLLALIWAVVTNPYYQEVFIKVIFFPGLVFTSLVAMVAIWLERKINARYHLRVGPYHVGPVMGFFQPIADFLKLIGKEIIIPDKAHKILFQATPVAAVTLACLSLAFIPFGWYAPGRNWVVYYTPFSLLLVLLLFSLRPFAIIAAGWSARSKYCTLGALRAAFQLLAYEVPIVTAIVSVVMVAGSFDLVTIVEKQSGIWNAALLPIGFIVIYISMMAEMGRRPFDIPQAEQEIVAGWFTEYTGVLFACFMVAEYIDLYVGCLLVTLLFLGGWLGPAFIPPIAWFIFKSAFVITFILLLRGVFPRLRVDQLLRFGWIYLIPLGFVQIVIILILAQVAPGLVGL